MKARSSDTVVGELCPTHNASIAGECGTNMADRQNNALMRYFAENQRSVRAAESEGIRQRDVYRSLPRCMRHKVDRGCNRRIVEIDRRWHHAVTHREQTENRFD